MAPWGDECDDCEGTEKGEIYPPYLILIKKSEFDALNALSLAGVDDPLTDRISLVVDEVIQGSKVHIVVEILATVVVLNDCLVIACVNLQFFDHGRFNVGNLKEHNNKNVSVNCRMKPTEKEVNPSV